MTVTLPTDQICAVLARGGSGGGTLLRLLGGVERPDRGSILTNVRFSIIGNSNAFFNSSLNGYDNIKLAARLHGMNPAMLTELVIGLWDFNNLWHLPSGKLPGTRRRSMEMLVAALLPFDCYLIEDIDRADQDIVARVLEIIQIRRAGMIFTAKNPKIAEQIATFGSVITNHTVYAFTSVDEALENYVR